MELAALFQVDLTSGLWQDDHSIAVVSGWVATNTGRESLGLRIMCFCWVRNIRRLGSLYRSDVLAHLVQMAFDSGYRVQWILAEGCKSQPRHLEKAPFGQYHDKVDNGGEKREAWDSTTIT
jgi:hypothetical protein